MKSDRTTILLFVLFGVFVGATFGFVFLVIFFVPVSTGETPILLLGLDQAFWYKPAGMNLLEMMLGFAALGAIVMFGVAVKLSLDKARVKLKVVLETNKAKEAFISALLHFIRTPLSGIRWSLKNLLEESPKQFPRDDIEKLYQSDIQALDAVEHLLDVSRTSMARVQYNFDIVKVVEFQELARNSIDPLISIAQKKGLTVQINLSLSSERTLRIDKGKIANVIQSLFQNAIDYTKEGSITVKMEEKQDHVILSVADTGIGILKKDQSFIFSQFFRGENAKRETASGFGVGLYLAETFLRKHGGDIWFSSHENKGTVFFISLPLIASKTEEVIQKF